MERRETALWMREVLDHLNRCCDQWQSADRVSEQFAIQSIERDVAELQRVCRMARRQSLERPPLDGDQGMQLRVA